MPGQGSDTVSSKQWVHDAPTTGESMDRPDAAADIDTLPIVDAEVIAPLHDPDLGGDASFLSEVVAAFRDDTPPRLASMRDALQQGDADTLARGAHSVKGSSGNFGAARVQILCVEIERRGRDGQIEGVAPLLDRLHAEYALLLERLDQIIASAPTSS